MGRISSHRNPEAGVLKEQVVVLRPPRDPRPGRSRHGSRVVTFLVGQSVQGLRLSGRDSTVTNAASVGWRDWGMEGVWRRAGPLPSSRRILRAEHVVLSPRVVRCGLLMELSLDIDALFFTWMGLVERSCLHCQRRVHETQRLSGGVEPSLSAAEGAIPVIHS